MSVRNASGIPTRLPDGSRNPEYESSYYRKNRRRILAGQDGRREAIHASSRKYRENNKEVIKRKKRTALLKKKYHQTPDEWMDMFLGQGSACAICRTPLDLGNMQNVHTDHDHVTDEVRGILCNRCNRNIGAIEDPVFPAILEYIEKHGGEYGCA